MSLIRTNVKAHKGRLASGQTPTGYGPPDFQSAYNLPSATAGSGETVAVVDAYNDPDITSDLATYRTQYGLPACAITSGCFQVVNQDGQTSPLPPNAGSNGWDVEESLDVDMVSAICPRCHIILVEASSARNADLDTAEDEAVALGAKYVSNSWGECESSGETAHDRYFNHPGVAVTAASGDWGYDDKGLGCDSPSYPASSQYVTAVGGTTLTRDSSLPRGWTETVWGSASSLQGTGSGCSLYEAKPSWQTDSGCANRMTNDVSADANPQTGAAVYDSYSEGGWLEVGGTSEAAPIIAASYALAGPPVAGSYPASYPYALPSALNDVTSGANGTCTPAYFCTAGPGYDGPTGLGTPNGVAAFRGGPQGDIAGQVTARATGGPVAGATVTAASGGQHYTATTDAEGDYDLTIPSGSYHLTVKDFGYKPQTVTGVTPGSGQTVTENFTLAVQPRVTVSGTVTDGSGHHYPLYAEISVAGDPHGPVYTSPYTGTYRMRLPRDARYRLQVAPVQMAGYQTRNVTVRVGAAGAQQDIKLMVDKTTCTAPGYASKTTSSGTVECAVVRGGLMAGHVTDANTGHPLDGATVASASVPSETATTADAPGPGGDGFYELFAAGPANQRFTASDASYASGTATIYVAANAVIHQDYSLRAGRLTVSASSLSGSVRLGGSAARKVRLTNAGTAPARVTLGAVNNTFTPVTEQGPARAARRTPLPRHDAAPQDGPWTGITSYPLPISGNAVAYDHSTGGLYSVAGYIGTKSTAKGYVYDPASHQWSAIANAPAALIAPVAAFVNGTLYLAGGWGSAGSAPQSSVYAYDPGTNTWSAVASLPVAVADPAVAVLDGQIYVVGGCTPDTGACQPATAAVQRYDPATNTWTRLAPYPVPIALEACAGLANAGEVACAGGEENSASGVASTYVYNPTSDAWTPGADMPFTDDGMAYAGANGELQVVGGDINGSVSGQGAQYNPATSTWSALPSADDAAWRSGGGCGLYQIGGSPDGRLQGSDTAETLPGYGHCGTANVVPWLSESERSFTLAPGKSVTVTVTLNSASLAQPGTYTAWLGVFTDTPYQVQPLTVGLQANPPAAWGELSGTVTDASTGQPIADATVQICTMYSKASRDCGPVKYTVTTGANGYYQWWLATGYNPLQVSAAGNGYQPQEAVVKVARGADKALNFALNPN